MKLYLPFCLYIYWGIQLLAWDVGHTPKPVPQMEIRLLDNGVPEMDKPIVTPYDGNGWNDPFGEFGW